MRLLDSQAGQPVVGVPKKFPLKGEPLGEMEQLQKEKAEQDEKDREERDKDKVKFEEDVRVGVVNQSDFNQQAYSKNTN